MVGLHLRHRWPAAIQVLGLGLVLVLDQARAAAAPMLVEQGRRYNLLKKFQRIITTGTTSWRKLMPLTTLIRPIICPPSCSPSGPTARVATQGFLT